MCESGDTTVEDDFIEVIRAISDTLVRRGKTLALAESCTGGYIANAITNLPGASRFFTLGVVCYSAEAKQAVLGISAGLLERYGTVSEETAAAMALGVRTLSAAAVSLSITGVAGPDIVEGKEKGLVYVAEADEHGLKTTMLKLSGDRQEIKKQASLEALRFLGGVLNSWT